MFTQRVLIASHPAIPSDYEDVLKIELQRILLTAMKENNRAARRVRLVMVLELMYRVTCMSLLVHDTSPWDG